MRVAASAFAAVLATLVAAPALAEDGPQATAAPASAPGVADQIAEFLRTSPAARIDDDGVQGVTPRDDRKVHGEVSVGVGTGGYRSLYMRSDMPVGETGRVSVAIEDTRYGRGHGYGYGGRAFEGGSFSAGAAFGAGFGGPGFGGPGLDPQRCDREGMTPPRPGDIRRGPNGRCVRPLP